MSWKKKNNSAIDVHFPGSPSSGAKFLMIFKTLKFKLTILYSCLFFISSLLILFGVYFFSYSYMIKQTNQDLLSIARNLEKRLLKGDDYEDEDLISLQQVPPEIITVAKKAAKDLKLIYAKMDIYKKENIYEITGISGKNIFEIKITAAGEIVEIEKSRMGNDLQSLKNEINDIAKDQGQNRMYIVLFSKQGNLLAKSDLTKWGQRTLDQQELILVSKLGYISRISKYPHHKGTICIVDKQMFDGNILEIGISISPEENLLNTYFYVLIGVIAVLFVCGTFIGWVIAKKAMAGIERVTKTATEITSGSHLSNRVPSGNEGLEIALLVNAFNEMLSRINRLISELKEVSDNIAHDLRTPLTRIRGIVETTVNENPNKTAYREMAADVMEECDRLNEIVNTMLEITQTDSGVISLSKTELNLNTLLTEAFELFAPMAEAKQIDFKLELPEENIILSADKSRLQRMIANLLDNAVKYTENKGKVICSLQLTVDGEIEIRIKDTGCGISPVDQQHIFDRFFRCDSSRSLPGNGLGLSLAQAIIKAHAGTLIVQSTTNKGSSFIIHLPL